MVRRPAIVILHNAQTSSSLKCWPIKAKFYVEPPLVGGTKVCSRHLGHMTKMAATPMYGKKSSKIIFSGTGGLTGVNQKVLPVLSTEMLLHIWLSTEYYGFRPSSTAVDTVS